MMQTFVGLTLLVLKDRLFLYSLGRILLVLVKSEREFCDFIVQHEFICVLSNAFVSAQFISSQCNEMWL